MESPTEDVRKSDEEHGLGSSGKPVPRARRLPQDVPFLLTERDVALLDDLWRFRVLTTSQLELLRRVDADETLRFVSRLPLTRRLKGLYHHGFVRRIARPAVAGSREPAYLLDRAGARALAAALAKQGNLVEVEAPLPSRLPKAQGLDHLLLIAQALVAFEAAAAYGTETDCFQLLEWKPSHAARFCAQIEGKSSGTKGASRPHQQVTILPDAALMVRVMRGGKRARHVAFLEADRGTEPLKVLVAKAQAYQSYWHSGDFARDYGAPPGAGFWVLFTVPSRARAATLVAALQRGIGAQTMFRVALESDLVPERVAQAIWTEAAFGATVPPCHAGELPEARTQTHPNETNFT